MIRDKPNFMRDDVDRAYDAIQHIEAANDAESGSPFPLGNTPAYRKTFYAIKARERKDAVLDKIRRGKL